jgi:hypothetical protein
MISPLAQTDLAALTSQALTSRLGQLLGSERALLVDFLRQLAEMDRRRLHLELGYGPLFSFCTECLKLPKACAYRRITAARLLSQFPGIAGLLMDGRLCLTTLCLLKDLLTEESAAEILERAAGRTEEQVQLLVATLRPRPALPDLIRALPNRMATGEKPLPPEALSQASIGSGPEPGTAPEPATTEEHRLDLPIPQSAPRRAQVTPLSEELRVLRMTVGPQFMAELEEVKAALSHRVPPGSLEALFRECFRVTLETCSRRRRGAKTKTGGRQAVAEAAKPTEGNQPAKPPAKTEQAPKAAGTGPKVVRNAGSRYLPVAVRREVWERDGGRCAFVGSNGKRCGSRDRIEFHHRRPFAAGGEATVANCSLRSQTQRV